MSSAGARTARGLLASLLIVPGLVPTAARGQGACLNGRQWGDQWQSAMWARATGFAAWILWPHLDDETKLAVARLVEHEADRFLQILPKLVRSAAEILVCVSMCSDLEQLVVQHFPAIGHGPTTATENPTLIIIPLEYVFMGWLMRSPIPANSAMDS